MGVMTHIRAGMFCFIGRTSYEMDDDSLNVWLSHRMEESIMKRKREDTLQDRRAKGSFRPLITWLLASIASIAIGMTAWAGAWKNDQNGWWYQNDDGSYPTNTWQWIDGNGDGIGECYYFNEAGCCLISAITPDGCTVDASGAWTVNGIVQTKVMSAASGSQTAAGSTAADTSSAGAGSGAYTGTDPSAAQGTSAGALSKISWTPYDGYTIIVNTNTKKYHVPGCRSVKAMKEKNMGYSSDEGYLISQGYVACKNCH